MIRDYPSKNAEEKSFMIDCCDCDDPGKTKKVYQLHNVASRVTGVPQFLSIVNQEALRMGAIALWANQSSTFFFNREEKLMESYKQEFENIIIHTKQLKLKYMGDYESEEESDEQS